MRRVASDILELRLPWRSMEAMRSALPAATVVTSVSYSEPRGRVELLMAPVSLDACFISSPRGGGPIEPSPLTCVLQLDRASCTAAERRLVVRGLEFLVVHEQYAAEIEQVVAARDAARTWGIPRIWETVRP